MALPPDLRGGFRLQPSVGAPPPEALEGRGACKGDNTKRGNVTMGSVDGAPSGDWGGAPSLALAAKQPRGLGTEPPAFVSYAVFASEGSVVMDEKVSSGS